MIAAKNYIPHIDGMRAISVLAVIFFHFHLLGFSGGYIGVDVFFTISGYLIIGSIVGQAEAGRFRAGDFWGRRIRRLFPAIFSVLALTFVAGLFLMNPADLTKLARDSLFALVSLINFTLLGETDYFDLQGFNEPLLHFWSLALEEQFYLVFPLIALILLAISRKSGHYKRVVVWSLLALSALSLIGAELALRSGHSLFAYYMMPTRFFQLALGGVLAIGLQSEAFRARRAALPKLFHDLMVVCGIAVIIGLSLVFTKTTAFPGLNALWPTLAALALLYSGGSSHLSFLLDNPVSEHLGKISYSLYLVHWPVWSFMGYYLDRQPDLPDTVLALTLTYILSFLIYSFVETPVRFSSAFKGRRLFAAVVPAAALSAIAFGATIQQQGWVQRIPELQREFARDALNFHREQFGGLGYDSQTVEKVGHPRAEPEFLIFGDSKAGQFAYGLDQYLRDRNRAAYLSFQNGCHFIPNAGKIDNGRRIEACALKTSYLIDFAKEIGLPVLSIRSWNYSPYEQDGVFRYFPEGRNVFMTEEEYTNAHWDVIQTLADNGSQVTILGNNDLFGRDTIASDCITRPTISAKYCSSGFSVDASETRHSRVEIILEERSEDDPRVSFIKGSDIFCPDGRCRMIAENGDIHFSDAAHLSKAGALALTPNLLKQAGFGIQIGPELVDVPSYEEVWAAIDAAWAAKDDAALTKEIENLMLVIVGSTEMSDLLWELWSGDSENDIAPRRELALRIAKQAHTSKGDWTATYLAGLAYWFPAGGVEKDLGKTIEYWMSPSQDINAYVQYNLAVIFLDEGSPHYNPVDGMARMRESARLNYAPAVEWIADNGTD